MCGRKLKRFCKCQAPVCTVLGVSKSIPKICFKTTFQAPARVLSVCFWPVSLFLLKVHWVRTTELRSSGFHAAILKIPMAWTCVASLGLHREGPGGSGFSRKSHRKTYPHMAGVRRSFVLVDVWMVRGDTIRVNVVVLELFLSGMEERPCCQRL